MFSLGLQLRRHVTRATGPGRSGSAPVPAFAMTDLWSNGEEGVWYDARFPLEMSRVSTGKNPIEGPGDPVGLRLDRKSGVAIEPNLVTGYDVGAIPPDSTAEALDPGDFTTTQWVPVTAGDWYRVLPLGGTATRRRVQTKDAGGVITFQPAPLTFEGTPIDWIFQAPTGATQLRIYFRNTGDTATGLLIGRIPGHMATQTLLGSRPFYRTEPSHLEFVAPDNLITTFPSALGSACTVARAIPVTGAQILTAQTVGTTFTDTTNAGALVIVDRALTPEETTGLTDYLNSVVGL